MFELLCLLLCTVLFTSGSSNVYYGHLIMNIVLPSKDVSVEGTVRSSNIVVIKKAFP